MYSAEWQPLISFFVFLRAFKHEYEKDSFALVRRAFLVRILYENREDLLS